MKSTLYRVKKQSNSPPRTYFVLANDHEDALRMVNDDALNRNEQPISKWGEVIVSPIAKINSNPTGFSRLILGTEMPTGTVNPIPVDDLVSCLKEAIDTIDNLLADGEGAGLIDSYTTRPWKNAVARIQEALKDE